MLFVDHTRPQLTSQNIPYFSRLLNCFQQRMPHEDFKLSSHVLILESIKSIVIKNIGAPIW